MIQEKRSQKSCIIVSNQTFTIDDIIVLCWLWSNLGRQPSTLNSYDDRQPQVVTFICINVVYEVQNAYYKRNYQGVIEGKVPASSIFRHLVQVMTMGNKPEDHWSCIAHLSSEDMLKSAVIEEKKFKHSHWAGAYNPLGSKF